MIIVSEYLLSNVCSPRQKRQNDLSAFKITAMIVQLINAGVALGLYFNGYGLGSALFISGGIFIVNEAVSMVYLAVKSCSVTRELKKKEEHKISPIVSHGQEDVHRLIFELLSYRDLARLGQTCTDLKMVVDRHFLKYSKQFDFRGSCPIKSKKYLSVLFHGVRILAKEGYFLAKTLKFDEYLFFKKVNVEKTLPSLISLSPVETLYQRTQYEIAIFKCVKKKDASSVNALLILGARPNCRNRKMKTPLHVATEKGFIHVVRVLLLYKADPNIPDSDGFTSICLNTSNHEITQLLLENGADMNYQVPKSGKTALFYATDQKQEQTINVLKKFQKKGEDVNG